MRIPLLLIAACAAVACGPEKKSSGDPLAHCGTGLCADGPLYATTTLAFIEADAQGHTRGFHLEGADTGACPSSNNTDVNGNPVDNQVANVIPVLYSQIGSALPTLIQNAVNDGGIALVLEIVGDPTRDTNVHLVVHHGSGAPLLGADKLMLANQTLMLATEAPLGICRNAKVANGVLSCGPFDMTLPVQVFGVDYSVDFLDMLMTMTLPADGADSEVLLGGAVTIANIKHIAEVAGPGAGDLGPVVDNVIPGLADVPDPVTGECNRISGAIGMTARSVYAISK